MKKLEIENYSIEFDRYKKDYGLVIDENINSLTIKVELEDDKATYEIIGADDLKANNYETKIIVTAENSKQRTYTIYSRFEDESAVNEEIIIEDKEEEKESSFQLTQQQLIIITIIGGVLLIIIILIAIFIHKKNRKLEKVLNNL